MEYLENEITDILFEPEKVTVTYDNNQTEVINKTKEGYKLLYNAWLQEQPMFISDIFKTQMHDLSFAARGYSDKLDNMNRYFSEENREEALKFIVYMRKRDLTFERAKWNKV
jgi:hypothetical protein